LASPEERSDVHSAPSEVPALLAASGGRVVAGKAHLLTLGHFSARGQGLALVGEHGAFMRFLMQRASLEQGALLVAGEEPHAQLRSGALGLCRASLEWDATWTVQGALEASAALGGAPHGAARRTLDALRLSRRRSNRIEQLTPLERRLLTLAAALVTEPQVVVLERPFWTLTDSAADLFETVLAEHLVSRSWIALLDLGGPWDRRLCERADAGVLVARGGHLFGPLEARDWLGDADVFWVRAGGTDGALSDALREAGAEVTRGPAPGTLVVRGASGRKIAELTARTGVTLHELAPLGHARLAAESAG
jgi:predicted ABC-type transport system involved in lysophospholipase L1 biosynthesis ATPase subunit